jgi:undecaprenyl-diphosphatase
MKLLYSIHKYDIFMFTWLLNARLHKTLAGYSRYISKTGDGPLYILFTVFLYGHSGLDNVLLRAILLGFLIERPVYFVLKNTLRRNRPEAALTNFHSIITPSDKFSFPSGHTSAAFMMATLIGFFYPSLMPLLYGWSAMVAFSRVLLGVHFPTDTLMGALLGIGTAFFSLKQVLA